MTPTPTADAPTFGDLLASAPTARHAGSRPPGRILRWLASWYPHRRDPFLARIAEIGLTFTDKGKIRGLPGAGVLFVGGAPTIEGSQVFGWRAAGRAPVMVLRHPISEPLPALPPGFGPTPFAFEVDAPGSGGDVIHGENGSTPWAAGFAAMEWSAHLARLDAEAARKIVEDAR